MSNIAEVAHNEVWDDSALVAGWDKAREEYERYHSIAARGEPLELETVEEAPLSNGAVEEAVLDDITTTNDTTDGVAPTVKTANTGGIGMPQALLGSTQDEGLKNLMMAWYYAGYYTGLHEGQQKAWAERQKST